MSNSVVVKVDIGYFEMVRFLFHGAYYKGQGVAEVGISLLCLGYYLAGFVTGIVWLDIIMLIFGLFFTVIYPLYLLGKAAMMMFGSRKNKSSTEYHIADRGIKVRQDREEANLDLNWGDIFFMHETKGMIYLYMTPKMALMLPKKQIKNDEESIKELIKKNMEPKRCKFLKQK